MNCENPGHARGASPLLLCALLVLLVATGSAVGPLGPDRARASDGEDWRGRVEAAAREVFERNLAAIEARDAEAYLSCYQQDEHLLRVGFGGISRGYEELAAGTGENWPDRFEAHDLRVVALTEDVAYGRYRYRVTYGEEVVEGISERVFLRTGAGWRIAVTTAFEAPDGALPANPPDDGGEER